MRRVGDVLVIDTEALGLVKEEEARKQSQKRSVIGYCSCGATYPPGLNAVGTAMLDA